MKIEKVKISDIETHPRNPKQHPEKQLRLLEESIKRFGWTNPVILSADNVILAGHARVKAAIAAGNDTVPCIRTKLSGKEADAYLIADNRLSDLAPYDRDILAELLSDLPKDLADITGFEQVQIDALLSGEDIPDIDRFISDSQPEEPREEVDAEPQIDRAAELNEKWQVQAGDMWQCGDHRLICGDCTDPAVVERLMQGEKADLWITDPPYAVSYADKNEFLNQYDNGCRVQKPIENDHLSLEEASELWFNAATSAFTATKEKSSYYWFACQGGDQMMMMMMMMIDKANWKVRHELIWIKNNHVLGRTDYAYKHEPILFGWKKKGTHDFYGGFQTSVLEYNKPLKSDLHPTMKPVALIQRLVENSSDKGHIVLETFAGSGTTLIACENTGRKARGIEISPDCCAVVLQRFKDATGKEPVRING
ncbi:MAG: site-specific DNA-methyltransferase [Methanoregula sp.]|jgi:DNA modification methylase|nr:site-specific DNA-methyltransferase [Methanoregula sp.]